MVKNIFPKQLELVIFDVDGTLYQQSKLRKIMLLHLFCYYLIRPWRLKELLIIYHFRKEREKRAGLRGADLEQEQYVWCAEKVNLGIGEVKKVVDKWIFDVPNQYLKGCMYPGVAQFLSELASKGIKTGIYSDYTAKDKLNRMSLHVDIELSSTDDSVNCFKPLPDGLLIILSEMKVVKKENCLFIGDRYELDGICAKAADIPFVLIDPVAAAKGFYIELSNELNRSGIKM